MYRTQYFNIIDLITLSGIIALYTRLTSVDLSPEFQSNGYRLPGVTVPILILTRLVAPHRTVSMLSV